MPLTLGLDPGACGAFAVLDAHRGLVALEDLPNISGNRTKWTDASALLPRLVELKGADRMHAVVERQSAWPGQGVVSAFSHGCSYGSVLAILQSAGCSVELVAPTQWKRSAGLNALKSVSIDRARLLYPTASLDRVRDHNRAEALLLAHWAVTRLRAA